MDILRFIFFNISSISIYVLATLFSITSSQIPEDLVPLKEYDTQGMTTNYKLLLTILPKLLSHCSLLR